MNKQAAPLASVRPSPYFNPEKDAEVLRRFTADSVIEVAASRTKAQRLEINQCYKSLYDKDFVHDLKKETTGDFQKALTALFIDPIEYDALCLNAAMSGLGTDEKVLIEILISRSNEDIQKIKHTYASKYGKELENDIASETAGDLQEMLLMLLKGDREDASAISKQVARVTAAELYNSGERKLGTDERKFSEIFCRRSFWQLREIFKEYEKMAGHDILNAINSEFSGNQRDALKAIAEYTLRPPAYFARRLYRSMKGAGTDDSTLIRVIVTRCEVDMLDIKKIFKEQYGKTLEKYIEGDTSGPYKKLLLSLVKE